MGNVLAVPSEDWVGEGLGVEPNSMGYSDQHGIEHEIYIPRGSFDVAWDHLENERWDELAKFEPYTGQQYTKDDFFVIEVPLEEATEKTTETAHEESTE